MGSKSSRSGHEPPSPDRPLVAWGSWFLPLPADWRFFQVEGNYARGLLVLGDEERPRLELSWVWVTRRSLNPDTYVRKFLLGRVPYRQRKDAAPRIKMVSLAGFEVVATLQEEAQTVAVGYTRDTHRLLHWVYKHGTASEDRDFSSCCLPNWRDQPLKDSSLWRFFGLSFQVPEGFRLNSAALNLGDMLVVMRDPSPWGSRHRLVVRFLYPASLALSRQSPAAWMKQLFRSHQGSYRPWGSTQPCRTNAQGLMQKARLHFLPRFLLRPLWFRLPGRAEATLVEVTGSDRLLYLQVEAPDSRIESTRELVWSSVGLHG